MRAANRSGFISAEALHEQCRPADGERPLLSQGRRRRAPHFGAPRRLERTRRVKGVLSSRHHVRPGVTTPVRRQAAHRSVF